IHDQKTFSVNVCCTTAQPRSSFNHVSNVFHPSVIDACLIHDGEGIVPGIKDEAGNWSLRPHRHRVIAIDKDRLSTFAKLYDEPDTPGLSARLPHVHSEEIVSVLEKIAAHESRLADHKQHYYATLFFDETQAQKEGTIRRETVFPSAPSEWIVSGPHF